MVEFNERHILWNVKEENRKLIISEGALLQTLKSILKCNDDEIKEYILALERDVKVSLLASYVEDIVANVNEEVLSIEPFNEYFYEYTDFMDELGSILEYFISDDKKCLAISDKITSLNPKPNLTIIKPLMMFYGVLACNENYFSKKMILDPLNPGNITLKKVRNRYLNLDGNYSDRKDYKSILVDQSELTVFLENIQMNGTYEQSINKSINMYYYNKFTRMIDITLFTERVVKSVKYLNYLSEWKKEDYSVKKDDIIVLENLSEFSLSFLNIEGMLTRGFVLKRALELIHEKEIGKEEIEFLNIVFEECRDELKEELCNFNAVQSGDIHSYGKLLNILNLEEPYEEILENMLSEKIETNSFEEYYMDKRENVIDFLKQDIFYFLYKHSREHEQVNA